MTAFVIVPLCSIIQYAAKIKVVIQGDTSLIKAWVTTYPLIGVFNIIFFCWVIRVQIKAVKENENLFKTPWVKELLESIMTEKNSKDPDEHAENVCSKAAIYKIHAKWEYEENEGS